MRERILAVLLIERQVRRCIEEDRLFGKIIADHLRHEIVNALVIRDAIARRIHDRDMTGTVRAHEIRDADQGRWLEIERIEVLIADAAIERPTRIAPS